VSMGRQRPATIVGGKVYLILLPQVPQLSWLRFLVRIRVASFQLLVSVRREN
jgi:hypothetical protein